MCGQPRCRWVAVAMDGSERQHPERQPASVGGGADGVVDLHVCPECGSGLVHPTRLDADGRRPLARLPALPRVRVAVASASTSRASSTASTRSSTPGTDSLYADLRRLERMNMEAELRRFNAALGEDLILPEDF